MAHVSMHQSHDSGALRGLIDAVVKRRNTERELNTRKEINSQQIAKELQVNQSRLDNDMEIAKLNLRNQRDLAKFKAGIDMQLKQMGVDLDLELQKMKNFNAVEIQQLQAKLARDLEVLRDTHKQNEILKTYETELKLAEYNQTQALLQTYIKTIGDVYRTGNPLDNAVDAAAYSLWALAFKMAYADKALQPTDDMNVKNLSTKIQVDDSSKEETNESIEELIKTLKGASEHVAPGSKITKYAQPKLKTKIKLAEKARAGSKSWEKR